MIQPLRNAHRTTFLLLGVGLPALFVAALASRNQNPLGPQPVIEKSAIAKPLGDLYFQAGGQRQSLQISGRGGGSEPRQLIISAPEPFASPELLIYWSQTEANGTLPANAVFLCKFEPGRAFTAPEGHADDGFLLLYDAPHRELVATFHLEPH